MSPRCGVRTGPDHGAAPASCSRSGVADVDRRVAGGSVTWPVVSTCADDRRVGNAIRGATDERIQRCLRSLAAWRQRSPSATRYEALPGTPDSSACARPTTTHRTTGTCATSASSSRAARSSSAWLATRRIEARSSASSGRASTTSNSSSPNATIWWRGVHAGRPRRRALGCQGVQPHPKCHAHLPRSGQHPARVLLACSVGLGRVAGSRADQSAFVDVGTGHAARGRSAQAAGNPSDEVLLPHCS